jgi:hypothetical protein
LRLLYSSLTGMIMVRIGTYGAGASPPGVNGLRR